MRRLGDTAMDYGRMRVIYKKRVFFPKVQLFDPQFSSLITEDRFLVEVLDAT